MSAWGCIRGTLAHVGCGSMRWCTQRNAKLLPDTRRQQLVRILWLCHKRLAALCLRTLPMVGAAHTSARRDAVARTLPDAEAEKGRCIRPSCARPASAHEQQSARGGTRHTAPAAALGSTPPAPPRLPTPRQRQTRESTACRASAPSGGWRERCAASRTAADRACSLRRLCAHLPVHPYKVAQEHEEVAGHHSLARQARRVMNDRPLARSNRALTSLTDSWDTPLSFSSSARGQR